MKTYVVVVAGTIMRSSRAELEQLAVNTRRAPERVGDADVADKLADFGCGLRPSAWTAGFRAPVGLKASAMPADYCVWLDDLQAVEDAGRQRVKPREIRSKPENAMRVGDLRRRTFQLVPED